MRCRIYDLTTPITPPRLVYTVLQACPGPRTLHARLTWQASTAAQSALSCSVPPNFHYVSGRLQKGRAESRTFCDLQHLPKYLRIDGSRAGARFFSFIAPSPTHSELTTTDPDGEDPRGGIAPASRDQFPSGQSGFHPRLAFPSLAQTLDPPAVGPESGRGEKRQTAVERRHAQSLIHARPRSRPSCAGRD